MNTIEALKPCPFCGGEADTFERVGKADKLRYTAECNTEECVLYEMTLHNSSPTRKEAIKAWNTETLKAEKTTDAGEDENTHRTLIHTQDDLKLSQQQCREQEAEIDSLKHELSKMKMGTVRASKTQPRETVDVEGLKRMTGWIPTSRKEKDLANYGWNACIDHLIAQGLLTTKENDDDK